MRPSSERERKHEELLAKFGVSEGDLRRWRLYALAARRLKPNDPLRLKRYGREAAVEEAGNFEHCRDLAGKFARSSARRTGDLISNVLTHSEKEISHGRGRWQARSRSLDQGPLASSTG